MKRSVEVLKSNNLHSFINAWHLNKTVVLIGKCFVKEDSTLKKFSIQYALINNFLIFYVLFIESFDHGCSWFCNENWTLRKSYNRWFFLKLFFFLDDWFLLRSRTTTPCLFGLLLLGHVKSHYLFTIVLFLCV